MQDLIVGERYHVKAPNGYWSGEVTYLGRNAEEDFVVKDVIVKKGDDVVQGFFKRNR